MRLDEYLHKNSLTDSRSKAQNIILAGAVMVNGVTTRLKAHNVKDNDKIEILLLQKFVSRAGYKLEGALSEFNIDVTDLICLDIGASTGGFTDCLLQNGARKVYSIDVGHNQLVYKLRKNENVVSIEGFNAKNITRSMFEELPQIIVSDVSFISISKIAPIIKQELFDVKFWISLIKPQFEAERNEVGKGGIIRDDKLRESIVNRAVERVCSCGFKEEHRTVSPIKGSKGNIEYLSYFSFK